MIVSLPNHLREPLQNAIPHLPLELAHDVELHISSDSIPYDVLLALSRWARPNARSSGLDPQDYTMLSLLAGTRTTPGANFVDATSAARRAVKSDRRAVTALVNAVFSVAGAGTAGWWAASSSGWKPELCVLMGLFVAVVVAVTEAVLFMIWQKRRDYKPPMRRIVRRVVADIPSETTDTPFTEGMAAETDEQTLRHRKVVASVADDTVT